MLLGRRCIPSSSTIQFILPSTQVRYKTRKHLYKGSQPRPPKPKVSPTSTGSPSQSGPQIQVQKKKAVNEKPKVIKKANDPMAGLRAAAKKETTLKYIPKNAPMRSKSNKPSQSAQQEEDEEYVPDLEYRRKNSRDPDEEPDETPPKREEPERVSMRPSVLQQNMKTVKRRNWRNLILLVGIPVVMFLFFGRPKLFGGGSSKESVVLEESHSSSAKAAGARVKPAESVEKAIETLKKVLGDKVTTDPEDLDDFRGEGAMNVGDGTVPAAVVFPETSEEVEVILKVANDFQVPVIPYSGGTSLEGQCVPVKHAITISLRKMDKIISFRPQDMDITVQPGISWSDLNIFLKPYKLFLPVDPAPTAHIGGMIACSSSGTNAVRYGTMKDWVLSLNVVLPGGHLMKTRCRARKNSTGYDLTRLFVGSEGTLGVITEVTLKLAHLPEKEVVGAIAFESNTDAANAVIKVFGAGIEPRCIELLDPTCIGAVNESLPKSIPRFPIKPHLFFKLSGSSEVVPIQQKSLISILKSSGGSNVRLARNEKEGEQIWDIRKTLLFSILGLFPNSGLISTDVCVPLSRLPVLIDQYKLDQERINKEIEEAGVGKPIASAIVGHIGDGNFHSLIAYEKDNPEIRKKARELEDSLVLNAIELDGTASGEHGVGIHKLDFMRAEYDRPALDLMRAIKEGIDPHNIMNPGALIPDTTEPLDRKATMNLENLQEWIIKPKSLAHPVETNPYLSAVLNIPEVNDHWGQIGRWAKELFYTVSFRREEKKEDEKQGGEKRREGLKEDELEMLQAMIESDED